LTAQEFYQQQIILYNSIKQQAQKKVVLLASLRLGVFVAAGFSVYFLAGFSFVYWIVLVEIALFLVLVHRSADANYEKKRALKIVEINQRELNAIKGDWSEFGDGTSYRSAKHPFSQDMDLFGPRSLFQLINRTVTKSSEKMLAERLQNGVANTDFNNKAINEFSKHIDWCQQYLAEGLVFLEEDKEDNLKKIKGIHVEPSVFRRSMMILLPALGIGSTILFSFDLISGAIFSGVLAVILSVVGSRLKETNRIALGVNRYETVVTISLHRIALLEQLKMNDPEMVRWKEEQIGKNGELFELFSDLAKVQKQMSYRMNIFVGILLNIFLAWDFRVIHSWEKWLNRYGKKIESMEDQLAEIEVWISGAMYFNNYSQLTFAEFIEEDKIEVSEMGHPFIAQQNQVYNDLTYTEKEKIQMITGPNMAGKSTYLRSVGWTIISANAGFPVMAKKCRIPRLKLYTSMRNADDLSGSSSFFHAELSRLRFIVDSIESGEKVFVILDEILKGTNSIDKERGSVGFLKKLARLNARGIIATHDLSLCRLSDENEEFSNRYFDSTIQDEELSFDYKIREGVCQNMNASFLLKKMGLVE
jgi:DNA mismatch repair ATPase MutS